jgi:imipenem/basic amino acid-specific outer membrane pore
MKKITLSLVAISALSITSSFAADSLEGMFKEGKVTGQIRAFYIDRDYVSDYNSKVTPDRAAFALGGKLGYDTGSLYGVSAGAMFYTTNGIGLKHQVVGSDAFNQSKVDPTLFGQGTDRPDVTYLGQAYITGQFGKTTVKLGRQDLQTPLTGADDVRMTPNLFEAAVVINTDLPNTTLIGAYVTREAFGTFANGYYAATSRDTSAIAYGLQAGYGPGGQTGKFISMSKTALTTEGMVGGTSANQINGLFGSSTATVDDRGVMAVAAIYKGVPGLTAQVWDYRMNDVLNALYVQADYSWKCLLNPNIPMTLSGQYWKENGIGSKWAGDVDSTFYGVKLASKPVADLNVYVAMTQTGKDKDDVTTGAFNAASNVSVKTLNGGMITPWGGSPGFVQGTVNRLGYTAGTKSWIVGGDYNVLPNLNVMARYMKFDISNAAMISAKPGLSNGLTSWRTDDSNEADIDVTFKASKSLELKLRLIQTGMWRFDKGSTTVANGNAADNYAMKYNEYRVIANYNF